jgi:magnesium-transporting ATPase (P-type)
MIDKKIKLTDAIGDDKEVSHNHICSNFVPFAVRKEIKTFIEKFSKDESAIICMTGRSFDYVFSNYKDEQLQLKSPKKNSSVSNIEENSMVFHELAKIISERSNIFSRMHPSDKVNLVNLLKENKSNIVAMCGDGANDCGALLSADIGISISHKKGANITSHFYSSDESISCVEIILKNGRACFENSIIMLKFMIIYGTIQNCSTLLLYSINFDALTPSQFFYIDVFLVLFTCLLASKYISYNTEQELIIN